MSRSNGNDGYVDAHTHLYSGLAPLGMPRPAVEPETFVEILERVWWRLDRALDESSLRASARLYVAEALLHGTTALVDHHESPELVEGSLDVIADACQELGMRALVCYGATERNGGRDEARRGLDECRRFVESNQRPLVRGLVGLHAGFTVSDETIRAAGELARELGTVLHVHVAEDPVDVVHARSLGYAGPIDRLVSLDALVPGSILAHGVHLSELEVRLCAQHGCWLVQNPRSNESNRVGYPRFLAASNRVALGTDGFPADMVAEAEHLILGAVRHGEHIEQAFARLLAGAELIAQHVDVEAEVDLGSVVVGGRQVVQDGELVSGDIDEIRARAAEEAGRLWKRMDSVQS
ncbi:MAG: amidohydrolase family protein [Planctomycetota bacterium]|nr:amidohydrolase family protein [Planctomycetota bacterium]